MKIELWIQTNVINSRCSGVIEEDDEVWAEMSDIERERYMLEILLDAGLFDWGYEEKE